MCTRRWSAALVVGLLLSLVSPVAARAASGGDAVDACRDVAAAVPLPDPVGSVPLGVETLDDPVSRAAERACRAGQSIAAGTAATCRMAALEAGVDPADCAPIDGRAISPAKIAEYRQSWVHAALTRQRELQANTPLWDTQIVHTHNSFNASAYRLEGTDDPGERPTVTNNDPNQAYGLTDQLAMDVRFLELDVHWVVSPYGTPYTGGKWPTLCHGTSATDDVHVGCSWDRRLEDGLAEVRDWLVANPSEVLFVYLENQLNGDAQAHELVAGMVRAAFEEGPDAPGLVRPPAGQRCRPLPYEATPASLFDVARVVIVGNCGDGDGIDTGWGELVHQRGPAWDEGGDSTAYDTSPAGSPDHVGCAADTRARLTRSNFRRWYGDSTQVSATLGRDTDLTPEVTAAMAICGVNLVGFDQLTPDDGRLAALVWSWTPAEAVAPSGPCAVQLGSSAGSLAGRIVGRPCAERHPYACATGPYAWAVSGRGEFKAGAAKCRRVGTFASPTNGLSNRLLTAARSTKHAPVDVWVNYRLVGGTWVAN